MVLLRELSTLGEPARAQRVETFLKDASDEERGGFAALSAEWPLDLDRLSALAALRGEWERRKGSDWAHWARRAATPPRKARARPTGG